MNCGQSTCLRASPAGADTLHRVRCDAGFQGREASDGNTDGTVCSKALEAYSNDGPSQ